MTDTNGWPDPSRPGYPRDAERDGWHWLMIGPGVGRPFPMLWCADGEMWEAGDDGYVNVADVSTRWNYLGPCYTQADLDAAVQAEREACAATCSARSTRWAAGHDAIDAGRTVAAAFCADAIRARGDTSALAEALAQARRETWEKAAEIAKAHTKAPGQRNMKDQWRESVGAEIATAISAAAGEEGK